jgi:MraZ protein
MALTGSFSRTLDDKLRVAIPKEFRDTLQLPATAALYVAPGTDGSLALYTEDVFGRLGERLAERSPTRKEVRAFSRLFYAQARRVELDRQGRVRVPAELAERAGIEKEVILLGVQDHMELWDRRRWDQWLASNTEQYDEIAEAAFEGGDGNMPTKGE